MKQRKLWVLAGALVGTLVLAFVGLAGGKIKTKTFSSGTLHVEYADFETATHEFDLNKRSLKKSKEFKAARVKDVNVAVRSTNSCGIVQEIEVFSPSGGGVVLAESRSGTCGYGYGTGSESCDGTLAAFDDEAETPIADATTPPYDGEYVPEEPLSEFDGTKVKGTWRFEITDTDDSLDTNALRCAQLEIKYKRKKRR
jgi:hypothetical protein